MHYFTGQGSSLGVGPPLPMCPWGTQDTEVLVLVGAIWCSQNSSNKGHEPHQVSDKDLSRVELLQPCTPDRVGRWDPVVESKPSHMLPTPVILSQDSCCSRFLFKPLLLELGDCMRLSAFLYKKQHISSPWGYGEKLDCLIPDRLKGQEAKKQHQLFAKSRDFITHEVSSEAQIQQTSASKGWIRRALKHWGGSPDSSKQVTEYAAFQTSLLTCTGLSIRPRLNFP